MKSQTCTRCGEVVDEADRRWDTLMYAGTCPRCGSSQSLRADVERPTDMPRVLTARALGTIEVITRALAGLLAILLGLSAIVTQQFPGSGHLKVEPTIGLPAVIAGGLVMLMGVLCLLPRTKIKSDGATDGTGA